MELTEVLNVLVLEPPPESGALSSVTYSDVFIVNLRHPPQTLKDATRTKTGESHGSSSSVSLYSSD